MIRYGKTTLRIGIVLACLGQFMTAEATMAQGAPQPQTEVKTDFLEVHGKSGEWLDGLMLGLGVLEGYTRKGDTVRLDGTEALVAFNRVRGFAEVVGGPINPVFLRMSLQAPGSGRQSCVTDEAAALVPDLALADLRREAIAADRVDPKMLSIVKCLPADSAGRASLPPDFLLAFDAHGVLKPEFDHLSSDQEFLHALIAAGFYLELEGFSGTLRIK